MGALIERELAAPCEVHAEQDWRLRSAPLEPNSEQQNAINAISAAAGGFSVHLLYGVTGSGKTEVYLQSIASCLDRGEQALILLPEIALTPQTLSRFESRFAAPVVTLHSGMGDAERDRAWAAARQGSAAIILGTRSAVFVPLKKLGLLIIDEEHDTAFVQQDGLRYSARDVAIKRGQLEQCPVVLGSATPSLSWHNAEARPLSSSHPAMQSRLGGATPTAAYRCQRTGTVSRLISRASAADRQHAAGGPSGHGVSQPARLCCRTDVP